MAAQALLHHALLLLFLLMLLRPLLDFNIYCSTAAQHGSQGKLRMEQTRNNESDEHVDLVPIPEIRYLAWEEELGDNNRRKLAPFQLCSGCTCCASEKNNKSVCTTSACCYSITCGLPDKPYGVCAFTPKACNCTNCGT